MNSPFVSPNPSGVLGQLHMFKLRLDLAQGPGCRRFSEGNSCGCSMKSTTGWWFESHPSEKYEFVKWDDDITQYFWENSKNGNHTTNQTRYAGVLKLGETQSSSILVGVFLRNHPAIGVPPILGNLHMSWKMIGKTSI